MLISIAIPIFELLFEASTAGHLAAWRPRQCKCTESAIAKAYRIFINAYRLWQEEQVNENWRQTWRKCSCINGNRRSDDKISINTSYDDDDRSANDNRIAPDESVLNLLILKVSTNHTDADCKVNSINDSTIDGYDVDNVYNNDTRFEILQLSGLINKRCSSFFYPKIIIWRCHF